MEFYELTMEKCRVVEFQIPPAIRGIPTTWQGAAYAREHESVCPLPMNKVDLIELKSKPPSEMGVSDLEVRLVWIGQRKLWKRLPWKI